MSFDNSNNSTNDKDERKYHDRNKSDDLQISRTDMNMLIMNYLVTGKQHLLFPVHDVNQLVNYQYNCDCILKNLGKVSYLAYKYHPLFKNDSLFE